jgi:RHS repeat-associated protein
MSASPTAASPTPAAASSELASLPYRFEVNQGQTDAQVQFLSHGPGYTLFLTAGGATLDLPDPAHPGQGTAVRMDLGGANPHATATGLELLATTSNYFVDSDPSHWQTNVPNFARVQYENIYPGIDLVYHGSRSAPQQLEFDFVVHPGADPHAIQLSFAGTEQTTLDEQGNLVLHTTSGDLTEHTPVFYQEVGGNQQLVNGYFVDQGSGQYSFAVSAYDPNQDLVIDPLLSFATYLGGSDTDVINAVAADSAGNAYVVGMSSSTNFPTTTGSYQTSNGGSSDAFVSKLNPNGTSLIFSTYLGGVTAESGQGIAVNSSGNAYICGSVANSLQSTFPTTVGAFQTTGGGGEDAFVTELNTSGSALVYSTLYGGSGDEYAYAIALDSSGNAYITGSSTSTNLATVSPRQSSNGGGSDAFVAEFNSTGSSLSFGTYLGGSGNDSGSSIAVDGSGRIFVTGYTYSTNFPTASAYQSSAGGGEDAFVTAYAAGGGSYLYSTYLGGSSDDSGSGITVDTSDNAFVVGSTGSTNFPTTSGVYQSSLGGSGATNAFITRLNSSGSVTASTYLGGNSGDSGAAIALYPGGDVIVGGTANSSNFPTVNALQDGNAGSSDAVLARLSPNLTTLRYATYWGGSDQEISYGLAVDGSGFAYLAGQTISHDFPTSSGAFQTSLGTGGGRVLAHPDGFVVKLVPAPLPPALVPRLNVGAADPNLEVLDTPAGASGGNPGLDGFSTDTPVRYADGAVNLTTTDLRSGGFGTPWGQTRSWSNVPGYPGHASNGSGVVDLQLPYLLEANQGNTTIAVTSGTDDHYFDYSGGSYQERYFLLDTLSHNTSTNEFVLTDPAGGQYHFYDFSLSVAAQQRGLFKSYTDPYGNSLSVVSVNGDGTPAEVQRSDGTVTESLLYSYSSGLLSSVLLRRKVGAGSWTTIRQAAYSYYGASDSYGNAGDLKLAQVQDGSGNVLDTYYYRYYQSGDAHGYAHGLKYVFGPDAHARLAAAYTNPTNTTDSQASTYADYYFEYDSQQRVTKVSVAGAGTTYGGGNGQGSYTYSYTGSSNSAGYNSWATKTVETLPDGNQNIVYTNAYGEVMLKVFKDTTSGNTWPVYAQYDSAGRVVLTAAPSAISGYDDTKADLLYKVSGNYQYLNDNSGLLALADYASSTSASGSTAGSVAGYLADTKLQQGELGTAILQSAVQYFTHTAGGVTIGPLATSTVYRNTNGTGGEMTSYSYSWSGSTNGVLSLTVTAPTVTSGENGPGSADSSTTFFDGWGRPIWSQDGDGFLTYVAYDQATGAVTKTIDDVNTANTSDFSNLPSGWSTPSGGGLHLITQLQVDGLGRTTKLTDSAGNVTYTVYNDTSYEAFTYASWNSSTHLPTGPTEVVRQDRTNSYTETLTMTATPHLTNNLPDGTEAISSVVTLARTYTNSAGQAVCSDDYFSLGGLTYAATAYLGTANTNYYSTLYGFDVEGRRDRVQSPTGTIDRSVHDSLGRVVSTWSGTNDTPLLGTWSPTNNTGSANMVQATANVYDAGGVGDGNLTQITVSPGGNAAARVTQQYFDWRDRRVASKDGVQGSEDTSTHRPITYTTFDNLDEVTQVQQYDGDGVTLTSSNGVPQAPAAGLLRAQTTTSYDEAGRVYQTQVYSVDPSSGTVSSNALTTNTWYGHRGQVLETSSPGGVVTKDQYDGAGRVTVTYTTDGASGSSWTAAASVTGDNVLQQVEYTYDIDGNVILTITRQRNHDESATGSLGNATTSPKARVSYVAAYYDAANRLTATVDVGTNGGSAYSRPSSVPSASDTVLVVSYGYNNAGWVSAVTDPRGLVATTSYDNLGRTTQTIAAYTDGNPTSNSNKTTQYTYDGAGHVLTVKALEPNSAYQTTQFVYGVTTSGGSDINSNDALATIKYPDKSTGDPSSSQQVTFTINALGETKTATDRNGTVHTFSYDVLGRVTSDTVTTLGSGVDGAVRRLQTAYDTQGNAYLLTSYDAASGGNIVNQVQDVYNGLGQVTTEYQSHAGAVNTSTTPNVQYAYTALSGGANNSRLVSMTYPNGRVLNYNYGSGVDTSISRLTSLSDSSGTLQTYSYLGVATPVIVADPQPGISLTYVKQTGESNGDAGDQYTGLDRFGRIVDQRWLVTSTGTATDRFQYGYDRDSNRLYRSNLVNSAFSELYHANGSGNGYDNLNQLTVFARGTLNGSNDTIASPSHRLSWSLDALGNFSSVTTDGTPQSRTHNQQNQVTAVGSATLTFDANGNLTTDQNGQTYVYDAWNQLVAVKSGSTTLASYGYDPLGRRITETVSGTTTDVYFNSAWQAIEERVGGTTTAQYVWSPVGVDSLVERDRGSERLYAQQDAIGNVTALVNSSGTVVERYVYDPYGAVTFLTASWSTLSSSAYAWRYLHQGWRFDTATGLYNVRHRDESPTLGRWLETDPLGFGGGDPNLYRDEGNNPTDQIDPSGLMGITPPEARDARGNRIGGERWVPVFSEQSRREMSREASRFQWSDFTGPFGLAYWYGADWVATFQGWSLNSQISEVVNRIVARDDILARVMRVNPGGNAAGNMVNAWANPNFNADARVAGQQINMLAEAGVQWTSTAAVWVGGNRFVWQVNRDTGQGSWVNAVSRQPPTAEELAQLNRIGGGVRRRTQLRGVPVRPTQVAPVSPGVGEMAVQPPGFCAVGRVRLEGWHPALRINGRVYVGHMHSQAQELAGTPFVQGRDLYGRARLDATGRVVEVQWGQ